MPSIDLVNVSIDFPVFNARSRGLLNSIIGSIGGSTFGSGGSRFDNKKIRALENVSLHIGPGDRVGIVGPNGAGKTTLLRVLSGVYVPNAGHVKIDGRVSSLTDITLGMDPEGTGIDFIIARGIIMGMTVEESKDIIEEIVDFTELGSYIHLPISTYSSGMLLRLAFGVATAIKPDILLMDEMIGVGDRRFMDRARKRIENVINQSAVLCLASHNEEILQNYCANGVLVDEGRILYNGSIEECLSRYRNMSQSLSASVG
jgi:ABC-type polysaccharide/polyol phosphate transport system ATPase subunit